MSGPANATIVLDGTTPDLLRVLEDGARNISAMGKGELESALQVKVEVSTSGKISFSYCGWLGSLTGKSTTWGHGTSIEDVLKEISANAEGSISARKVEIAELRREAHRLSLEILDPLAKEEA